mgnify:CR=1 FL=1
MRMKEIFPQSVAEVKIIFVPLQSRSLHERGSALEGQGRGRRGEITRSLRSLIYNKLCSARHDFFGNKGSVRGNEYEVRLNVLKGDPI